MEGIVEEGEEDIEVEELTVELESSENTEEVMKHNITDQYRKKDQQKKYFRRGKAHMLLERTLIWEESVYIIYRSWS